MKYLGDLAEDATLDFKWNTADGSGGAITRSTDGTISVYKANGTTQSTAGITDTEDFDALTGVHHCRIDTSADAFYAIGNDYQVVLSAATVDTQTVNAVIAEFSIENRTTFPKADYPTNFAAMGIESDGDLTQVNSLAGHTAQTGDNYARLGAPAGASVSADVAAIKVDSVAILVDTAEIGAAGAGLTNIDLPNQTMDITGSITGNLSGTVGSVTGAVGSVTGAVGSVTGAVGSVTGAVGSVTGSVGSVVGHTAQTGDNFARIGAPAGASVSADVAAVKVDTAATLVDTAEIGAAGAGLTDLGGMSTGMKAEVNVEALDVLATDTHAELAGVPAATSTIVDKINWLFLKARNKITQTATTELVRNDGDLGTVGTSTVSDDTTTAIRGKFI